MKRRVFIGRRLNTAELREGSTEKVRTERNQAETRRPRAERRPKSEIGRPAKTIPADEEKHQDELANCLNTHKTGGALLLYG
jgi:hypothetical protein